jgi:endoglycosylceramidase
MFDADGRQVLLRGVDYNALGDYYQADPDVPTVIAYSPRQLDLMAAEGFDVIRLVLSWSKLEPERGHIDMGEIARIRQIVDAAGSRGMYVVLDMHQDAWGKFIATPPRVTCPSGEQRAIGWDGAPAWATITDGESTCRVAGIRELAPAVVAAFDNFYADRDGIEDQFVGVWQTLARAFAADPAVAGYDLLNEPHYGSDPARTNTALASLYGRLVEVIRHAEGSAPGGFHHIVFFEPNILWSGLGTTSVPSPSFTTDSNVVFAPHLYGGSLAPISVSAGYAAAEGAASSYGTTMWSGEWGAFTDPGQLETTIASFARLQDQTLTGGAWWQWSQSCGDPHTINSEGNHPTSVLVFNLYACPGNRYEGAVPQWAEILSRSYPIASPGRLISLRSEPSSGEMQLTGDGRGTLELWVPDRPNAGRPMAKGSGFVSKTTQKVEGGWHLWLTTSGNYEVTVTARGSAGT